MARERRDRCRGAMFSVTKISHDHDAHRGLIEEWFGYRGLSTGGGGGGDRRPRHSKSRLFFRSIFSEKRIQE